MRTKKSMIKWAQEAHQNLLKEDRDFFEGMLSKEEYDFNRGYEWGVLETCAYMLGMETRKDMLALLDNANEINS